MPGPFIEPDDPQFGQDPPGPEVSDDKNECIAPSPILPNEKCVGDLIQAYADLIGDAEKAKETIVNASMQALVNFSGVEGDLDSAIQEFVDQIRETKELESALSNVDEFADAAAGIIADTFDVECPEDLIGNSGFTKAANRIASELRERLPLCNIGRIKERVLNNALEALSVANIAASALGITGNDFCAVVQEAAETLKSGNLADLVDPDLPGPTPPKNVFAVGNMDRRFIVGWEPSDDPTTLGYAIRVGKTLLYLATKDETIIHVSGVQNNTELDITMTAFNESAKEGDATEAVFITPASKEAPPSPVIQSVLTANRGISVTTDLLPLLTESISEFYQTEAEVEDTDNFILKLLTAPISTSRIVIEVTEVENVTRAAFYDLDNSALIDGGELFDLDSRPDTPSGIANLAIGIAKTDELIVTYKITLDPRRTTRIYSSEEFEFILEEPTINSTYPVTEILKVVNKSRQDQSYDITGATIDTKGNQFKLLVNEFNTNIGLSDGDEIETFYIRRIPEDFRGLFLRYRELGSSVPFEGPFLVSDGTFESFTYEQLENGVTYEFQLTTADNDVPPNESVPAVFAATPRAMKINFEKFIQLVTLSVPFFGSEVTIDGTEYGIGDIIPLDTQLATEFSLDRDNSADFNPKAWLRLPDFTLIPLRVERINSKYFRVHPEKITRILAKTFIFRRFGIRSSGTFGFNLPILYLNFFNFTIPIRILEEDEVITDLPPGLVIITKTERVLLTQVGVGQEGAIIVRSFGENGDWDESSFPFFVETVDLPKVDITSVEPNEIPLSQDEDLLEFINVEVIGENFVAGMKVESDDAFIEDLLIINSENASFRIASDVLGSIDIRIINVDGDIETFSGLFTVVDADPPIVEAITPNQTSVGQSIDVVIRGQRFRLGAIVTFNGEQADSVSVESGTLIACTVPDTIEGVVDVKVINPDGKEGILIDGFIARFPFAPEVLDTVPRNTVVEGGETIAIVGSNFVNGAFAFFDDNLSANTTFINENQLNAEAPPADAIVPDPGFVTGFVDVKVQNTDLQESALSDTFEYVLGQPVIDTVSPPEVITDGGTLVTLEGSSFYQGLTITIKTGAGDINVPSGDITLVDNTEVNFVMPASLTVDTPETVEIELENIDGKKDAANIEYILCTPQITSISPNSGTRLGGFAVTISGDCFFTGTQVFITKSSTTVSASISIADRNTINISSFPPSPDGATGTATVKVQNVEGNFDTITFTYT